MRNPGFRNAVEEKQEVSRMGNEMSRRVCKKVLFRCVLLVRLAAAAGAVEVGERIGPLRLFSE